MKSSQGVNFINVFCMIFSYESLFLADFSSYVLALAPKFCTNNVRVNIDEIVTRYALIFHLKNPFALEDQFCITFICLWNFIFSFIYNSVFFLLPGKKPLSYYICTDIDPSSDSNLPSQINIYIEVFSLILHLALNTRIKLYKRANAAVTEHQNSHETNNRFISLDEKTLTNLTTTASAILIFVTYMALNFKLTSLNLTKINSYPINIFVVVYTLLGPVILTILINTVYFIRTPKLRKCLWQELKKHFWSNQIRQYKRASIDSSNKVRSNIFNIKIIYCNSHCNFYELL